MSWRRLAVLLSQLPPESRCRRIVDPRLEWTTTDYLLAEVVDAIRGGNWQRGGGKGARPKRLERPGSRERMGKPRPLNEVTDLFARWRKGQLNARPIHKGVTHG